MPCMDVVHVEQPVLLGTALILLTQHTYHHMLDSHRDQQTPRLLHSSVNYICTSIASLRSRKPLTSMLRP